MKNIDIKLSGAGRFSREGEYAENLRMNALAGGAGCVGVGVPVVGLHDAGSRTVSLGGKILTVGSDMRTLALDGVPAGELSGHFLSALADGDRMIIFTDSGPEWLSGDSLQGAAPGVTDVALTVGTSVSSLSAEVSPPSTLSGTYTRLTEALQDVDCRAMVALVMSALDQLRASAALRGLLTQPAWVSWRMVDVDDRIVARGVPQRVGELQGGGNLTFRAAKTDTSFSLSGTSTVSVNAYGLTLSVGRSASEFWRRRVRTLEVILWPDCMRVASTSGNFVAVDSSTSTLTVAPRLEETARSGDGIIAARVDMPLEGVTFSLFLSDFGDASEGAESVGADGLHVSVLHAAGSINAYALNDEPGVIAVAPASDPLRPVVKSRICRGDILRICSPAGGGGGWNFGRHHLVAFASDGVFAVGVDGALSKISATPICGEGVARADAVAAAPDALYFATSAGRLLRLRGARIERVSVAVEPVALVWCGAFGELLLMDSGGTLYALDGAGGLSARTLFSGRRFVEPAMVVDGKGELRMLEREAGEDVNVEWRSRVADGGAAIRRRAEWVIDAADSDLTLSITLDGGGVPQRALELLLRGPVNAPVSAVFRAPRRPWLTARLAGRVSPPARLTALRVCQA